MTAVEAKKRARSRRTWDIPRPRDTTRELRSLVFTAHLPPSGLVHRSTPGQPSEDRNGNAMKMKHSRAGSRTPRLGPLKPPPNPTKALLMGQSGVVTTVAIVLAAGAGSRFSGPSHKLLSHIGGVTVAGRAIDAARMAGIGAVVVVIGAIDLPADVTAGCLVVRNPKWADGQATSVQCGLDAAREKGAEVAVIGLADQPFVTPDAWRAVAGSTSPIAVATYDGVRGNPVRLHKSVWPLLPAEGDSGARDLIRLRPDLVSEVACEGSSADIDTQEDLDSWT
ncbi:MAG: hypothetical protein B7C54_12375 [Acidimicrobiales bacterium mtb01]|nr:nucleotidyltransferase family protein [Actinomycetota bacterium]TEX45825.1 MAG: hypothetical protein B7C54_12375 [Acidimicrobiales bacterium mtb01]